MMLTMGSRQVSGLFASPINTATGLGIVSISFALAVGQFVWGAAQPVFGAAADRFGPVPIIVAGGLLLAIGTAITPFMTSEWGLVLSMGIMVAAGAGAGSFSILIAAAARGLPPERRSFGAGVVNAGGSFGQFVFAPVTERLIALAGWVNAMFAAAARPPVARPLALVLRRGGGAAASAPPPAGTAAPAASPAAAPAPVAAATAATAPPAMGMRQQLAVALRDRSYLLLH